MRESTQIVFHPENGEPRFLIGYNKFKDDRRIKRLVDVVGYEELRDYMHDQGPIRLPLMTTVHASLTLLQPQYKLEIKQYHVIANHEYIAKVIVETETGLVTRLTNQREAERWTQDHLSLKNRILAKYIRSLVIRVNTQKEGFVNDNSIKRFCTKNNFPFSIYQDFITLITYLLRRYPTTSHCYFCGLLFSEALLPERAGTVIEYTSCKWRPVPYNHILKKLYSCKIAPCSEILRAQGFHALRQGNNHHLPVVPFEQLSAPCYHCIGCGIHSLGSGLCVCNHDDEISFPIMASHRLWYR